MLLSRVAGWWKGLDPGFRYCIAMTLALRFGLSAWTTIVTMALPPLELTAGILYSYHGTTPITDGLQGLLLGTWQRWDAIWYLMIANQGYRADSLAPIVMPLYPLAMRLLAPGVGGSLLLSGLVITTISSFFAFLALYRLTELEMDSPTARRAVRYLAVFPTAFFLMAPYTEAMFLAFAIGSFLMARRGRWGWSGLLGAAAALIRVPGFVIALPLAVELFMQYRGAGAARWALPPARHVAAIALIPALAAGYIAWAVVFVGDQTLWGHMGSDLLKVRFALPWEGLVGDWLALVGGQLGPGAIVPVTLDLCAYLLFIGLAAASFRWMRPCYGVYMLAMLFASVTKISDDGLLQSTTRYVLVLFPGFMLAGAVARSSWLNRLFTYSSIGWLGLLTAVFTRWGWAG
jgi:hypothetical protein